MLVYLIPLLLLVAVLSCLYRRPILRQSRSAAPGTGAGPGEG